MVEIQFTYGAAADAMESDDGPCQSSPMSSEIAAPYEDAVECNSAASACHAAAADSMGAAPGPA